MLLGAGWKGKRARNRSKRGGVCLSRVFCEQREQGRPRLGQRGGNDLPSGKKKGLRRKRGEGPLSRLTRASQGKKKGKRQHPSGKKENSIPEKREKKNGGGGKKRKKKRVHAFVPSSRGVPREGKGEGTLPR